MNGNDIRILLLTYSLTFPTTINLGYKNVKFQANNYHRIAITIFYNFKLFIHEIKKN